MQQDASRARASSIPARIIITKLKLTLNETKTRVCKLPEEKFDFLGYTFGRCYSPKTGRAYLGTVPSRKRVLRICETISKMTERDHALLDPEMVVAKLNRTMIGWANYFCLGPVSKAYRAVERHACKKLRQCSTPHKWNSGKLLDFATIRPLANSWVVRGSNHACQFQHVSKPKLNR
jgi:hypothetical protein